MDTCLLDTRFARISARLKVTYRPTWRNRTAGAFSLDVKTARNGELIEIVRPVIIDVEVAVLDVQTAEALAEGWTA
jgi:hypothetical protein